MGRSQGRTEWWSYNFTAAAQTVGLNFVNSSSGAFSSVTNCPLSLAAGADV